MTQILIADDQKNIRDLAQLYLQKAGYEVTAVTNGAEAITYLKQDGADLLVLDLMMPEIDGWEVCRQVRAGMVPNHTNLPILMLTARDDDIDKIVGLEMGADDYLTKPFNPRELVARVKAILRRGGMQQENESLAESGTIRLGDVTLDPSSREVTVGDKRLSLRTKEFDLLQALMEHLNVVLSRDQMLNLVWGFEYYGNTRTVDVHIGHLRDKLSGSQLSIETVWGMGYKLILLETE